MVIGSNRYHENNSAIGMVITGSFTPEVRSRDRSHFSLTISRWLTSPESRVLLSASELLSGVPTTALASSRSVFFPEKLISRFFANKCQVHWPAHQWSHRHVLRG